MSLLPLFLIVLETSSTVFPGLDIPPSPPAEIRDPWWGRDKAWHFAVSHALSNALESRTSLGCYEAAGFTLGVGVVKELVDWKIRRTFFSWKDLVYDALGSALGCVRW